MSNSFEPVAAENEDENALQAQFEEELTEEEIAVLPIEFENDDEYTTVHDSLLADVEYFM